ncbi:stage II sporulation protein D [Parabacteroides sp. PFB2-12]|uniref:SpoIID/LytB domain-containing protein n=1 Tax=unclassified Parabacteroides TaxID=2649774 RepID=UPI002473B8C1|nr:MULTISPECIES: SpoIID/LytB domain-containing protein [unclassified Parabacteroides]MDH6344020.1 stage II sporulation protein D [Parabacteroides sp. PM6-13]MDH6391880.1 stage II sporulation protein D [Parabacteroides sp. PFB2-12]
MKAPSINVGILTGKEISFSFHSSYINTVTGEFLTGEQRVLFIDNRIFYQGKKHTDIYFEPASSDAYFELNDVVIGKDFHWERSENQRFRGGLDLVATDEGIVVINEINVEEYLVSVISSEMSATSSKELLKAHAVISRSWLLAQLQKNASLQETEALYQSTHQDQDRLIRWYDREDHLLFDVCADDHCQRYQGITRASTPLVEAAVRETRGEVLSCQGEICDARFSKCCGGVTEVFETCWEPTSYPYLAAVRDTMPEGELPDLRSEETARRWIESSPEAFCHTTDKQILQEVLNHYDQETSDFYRWEVTYTQAEISRLLADNYKEFQLGAILDLVPLKRGPSGRIEELQIVGSDRSVVIGKELEIRRVLSASHLYSSAFVVDRLEVTDGVPGRFRLKGAGWGHGVGLCQIGAAMMSTQGFTYDKILKHYYKGIKLTKRY